VGGESLVTRPNEQREFWGIAGRRTGLGRERNTIGIKNPAVDALIDKVIFAKDRAGTGGRDQGARPRAACGISMSCRSSAIRFFALCPLGIRFSPRRSAAENMADPACRPLWWYDAEKARQDRKAVLRKSSRMTRFCSRRPCPRPSALERSAPRGFPTARASEGRPPEARCRRSSCRRSSRQCRPLRPENIRLDFPQFDYINPAAPKGGTFFADPLGSRLQSILLHVQFAQTPFILKGEGRARGMGHDLRALDGPRQ